MQAAISQGLAQTVAAAGAFDPASKILVDTEAWLSGLLCTY